MTPDRLIIAIEASHSMSMKTGERTRFEEALLYARHLADEPVIFGFNSDWFMIEESDDGGAPLELRGSGLLAAALRGGRELSRHHGIARMIVFTDGPDEAVLPRKEAEACAQARLAVDIVLVAGPHGELAKLDEIAAAAGGKAIMLEPRDGGDGKEVGDGQDATPTLRVSATGGGLEGPGAKGGADEETVICIAPKETPAPPVQENGVKGILTKIKEKVW